MPPIPCDRRWADPQDALTSRLWTPQGQEALALQRLWRLVLPRQPDAVTWTSVLPLSESLAVHWFIHLVRHDTLSPASALAALYSVRRAVAPEHSWDLRTCAALKRVKEWATQAAVAAGRVSLRTTDKTQPWTPALQIRLAAAAVTPDDWLVVTLAAVCFCGTLRLGNVIYPAPFVPGLHTTVGDATFATSGGSSNFESVLALSQLCHHDDDAMPSGQCF